MSEDKKDSSFVIYNSKSGWKAKVAQGLKANGENQLKEVRVEADTLEGLVEQGINLIVDWDRMCTEKGIAHVSPYIKGREPKNV
jgi:hypothetical protein